MLELLPSPQAWLAFVTLSALEIVLGIDNIVFLSILVGRLPAERRRSARLAGLALAMVTRIALLYTVIGLTRLARPWFSIGAQAVSPRDLALLAGGLFLLGKSVLELHHAVEGAPHTADTGVAPRRARRGHAGIALAVAQIALIDIVFSLDSVFTAVGLVKDLSVMIAAIVLAILVMMGVSGPIGAFIERHPTIKVLALAFLILIGVALTAQAFHFEIPKGYLYFAMAFAVAVETINIRLRGRSG